MKYKENNLLPNHFLLKEKNTKLNLKKNNFSNENLTTSNEFYREPFVFLKKKNLYFKLNF